MGFLINICIAFFEFGNIMSHFIFLLLLSFSTTWVLDFLKFSSILLTFYFFFFFLPVFPSENCWSCFLKFTYFYSANCFGYSMSSYEIFHFSLKNSLWSQQPYVYLGEWCVYTICVSFSCFWYIHTHTCCVQYSAEYFMEKY